MKLKTFKPKTPSLRNLIILNRKNLSKKPYLKPKIKGLKRNSGRNFSGKITVFHKGGGNKIKYRQIDFKRNKNDKGIVIGIEYDPYRSSNIASIYSLIFFDYYYIIAPKNLKIGDIVSSGQNVEQVTAGVKHALSSSEAL